MRHQVTVRFTIDFADYKTDEDADIFDEMEVIKDILDGGEYGPWRMNSEHSPTILIEPSGNDESRLISAENRAREICRAKKLTITGRTCPNCGGKVVTDSSQPSKMCDCYVCGHSW